MKNDIRFAQHKDLSAIIELCAAHAHFEKCDYDRTGKEKSLGPALFADNPALFCLVVEIDGQIMGYATYMVQYSTWDACPYIYMDCLFMDASTRGHGLGEKLMQRIYNEGKKLNCDLIQWQTPEFNVRAIKFYNRLGATSKDKKRFYWPIN